MGWVVTITGLLWCVVTPRASPYLSIWLWTWFSANTKSPFFSQKVPFELALQAGLVPRMLITITGTVNPNPNRYRGWGGFHGVLLDGAGGAGICFLFLNNTCLV